MKPDSATLLQSVYPDVIEYINTLDTQGKLHHAYLISGLAEGGQHALARYWAARLLESDHSVHPDLYIVSAGEQGVISIEQARALQYFLSAKPQRAHHRIAIIEDAEAMTLSAANAMLKSIEETRGKNIILLTTSASSRIPATIRSRVHTIFLPRISTNTVEQYSSDEQTKVWIDGRFERLMQAINSDEIAKQWYTERMEWESCYTNSSLGERDTFIQQWFKVRRSKGDVIGMVNHVEGILRDQLHESLRNTPQRNYVLYRKLHLLQNAKKMVKQNVNSKLLTDYLIEVI